MIHLLCCYYYYYLNQWGMVWYCICILMFGLVNIQDKFLELVVSNLWFAWIGLTLSLLLCISYLIPELGPCSLRITYSAHTDLTVKFQSHRSRYTCLCFLIFVACGCEASATLTLFAISVFVFVILFYFNLAIFFFCYSLHLDHNYFSSGTTPIPSFLLLPRL